MHTKVLNCLALQIYNQLFFCTFIAWSISITAIMVVKSFFLYIFSQGVMHFAGSLKITPTIAWSTAMLAWGMLSFGEGYNKSSAWETGMQTLRWNTDYLLKTIKDDPDSTALSMGSEGGGPEYFIVYQVSWLVL